MKDQRLKKQLSKHIDIDNDGGIIETDSDNDKIEKLKPKKDQKKTQKKQIK